MRNHGWHLPYHPLQIVAVAVFSALAFSFYVFFVPFVGSNVLKFHIIAAFSPMVFAVFTLYIRCAAIDPADSGIRAAKQRGPATRKLESSADVLLRESERHRIPVDQLDEEASRNLQSAEAPERNGWETAGRICTCLCCPISTAWRCIPGTGLLRILFLGRPSDPEKYVPEEELLFCSLCEAEILKSSKHCRACDKCVDGFDHHCRWLNNCIGKKNYKTFVAVMIASVLMLIMEWSIGIFVLVRCFSKKHEFDKEIVEKLGSSFTRTPFVVVVALCTFLAMLATLPLTQLLFFHLILIKKGITTYDYIVAIREQEAQDPVLEGHMGGSLSSSPASSVGTGISGGSSSGPLHRGVWCTPPRMFVENQANMKAEVMEQYATSLRGASPRTDGVSGLGTTSRDIKSGVAGQPKRQIGLSAWKLARLSTRDATRASIRARESSSILRPVKYTESSAVTETEDSSLESGTETSTGNGGHKVGWRREVPLARDRSARGNEHRNPLFNSSLPGDLCSGRLGQHVQQKSDHPIFPLQSEARSPFRSRSLNTMGSFPFGMSAANSPDILGSPDLACGDAQHYGGANQERSWLYRATSDGYEASGGESADETSDQGRWLSHAWSKLKLNPSFINRGDAQHAPFKWPSGVDDLPPRSQPDSRASSNHETRSNGSRVEANILRHVKRDWPGIRDKMSTSTDGSNNSSPSHYVSSQGMSPDVPSTSEINFGSHLEKSSSRESGLIFYDGSFGGGSPKLVTGKTRAMPSARRLKESILSYRRGLSSSRPGGALLSSSP